MITLRGSDYHSVGSRRPAHALLYETIEELPPQCRIAPVEPESELVKITLEMLVGGAALEGAKKPSLEQRSNAMDSRKFFTPGSGDALMPIALICQPAIGPLAIADDQGAFGDIGFHEIDDMRTGLIRKLGKADSSHSIALNFSSDYHDILSLPSLVSGGKAANKGFVHFDITGQLFASWPNHSMTQFLQHHPCRRIAWQSEQSLEPHRVDAHFLVGHPPHRPKPQPQGYLASMECSARGDGYERMASLAVKPPPVGAPRFTCSALGTDKSFGPADLRKEIPA